MEIGRVGKKKKSRGESKAPKGSQGRRKWGLKREVGNENVEVEVEFLFIEVCRSVLFLTPSSVCQRNKGSAPMLIADINDG